MLGLSISLSLGSGYTPRPPPPPPVLADITYPIGALTATDRGGVRFSNLPGFLVTGSAEGGSWKVGAATSGTSTHWTRAGSDDGSGAFVIAEGSSALTPRVSSGGNSADLSSGTYVFPVTFADAYGQQSNTVNITITIEADAASMGELVGAADNFPNAVIGTTDAAGWSTAGARSILFCVGISRAIGLSGFGFTAPVRVRWADPARPGTLTSLNFNAAHYLHVEGLTVDNPGATGIRITLANCNYVELDGVYVGSTSAASCVQNAYALSVTGCTYLTLTDFVAENVYGGITQSSPATNVTINGMSLRYISDNGITLVTGCSDWSINDYTFIAPMRRPNESTTHMDVIQGLDYAEVTNIQVERLIFVQADGDAYCQGVFAGSGVWVDFQLDGFIYCGRAGHTLTLSTTEGADGFAQHLSLMKLTGPVINSYVQASEDQDDGASYGPYVMQSASDTSTGAFELSSAFIYNNVYNASATWTVGGDVEVLANDETNIATYFDVGNPRTGLEALTGPDWAAMSVAEIIAFVKAQLRPKVGGPLDLGGGIAAGAIAFDGTWNTGIATGADNLLLETGDDLLLESGDLLLME